MTMLMVLALITAESDSKIYGSARDHAEYGTLVVLEGHTNDAWNALMKKYEYEEITKSTHLREGTLLVVI